MIMSKPGNPAVAAAALRGTEGKKELHVIFRAVDGLLKLLQQHDMLPDPLEAALLELRDQLTDHLCPYTIEQLDAEKKKLDERFPNYEHRYHRCGTTVTWSDRRKPGA
jgi:hypothetical protein